MIYFGEGFPLKPGEKITVCPDCDEQVAYDEEEGEVPVCPICGCSPTGEWTEDGREEIWALIE